MLLGDDFDRSLLHVVEVLASLDGFTHECLDEGDKTLKLLDLI